MTAQLLPRAGACASIEAAPSTAPAPAPTGEVLELTDSPANKEDITMSATAAGNGSVDKEDPERNGHDVSEKPSVEGSSRVEEGAKTTPKEASSSLPGSGQDPADGSPANSQGHGQQDVPEGKEPPVCDKIASGVVGHHHIQKCSDLVHAVMLACSLPATLLDVSCHMVPKLLVSSKVQHGFVSLVPRALRVRRLLVRALKAGGSPAHGFRTLRI